MTSRLSRMGWRPQDPVIAAVLVALAVALTWDAWADIFMLAARDEENSHIFLVLPIAFWVAWIRRARLLQCRPRHHWAGVVIAGVGVAAFAWGWSNQVDALWHGGALLTVIGAFASAMGGEVVRRFLPAFGALAFVVPIPGTVRQAIALPLQSISAKVTQFVLDLTGMLVERSGNLIIIDDMPIAVAEACNGMRMVFALFLVMYAFAFSIPMLNGVRLLLLVASPLVAIVANVTRLVPTVLAYAKLDLETADMLHDLSGWLMLALAFGVLLGIEHMMRWALIPTQRFTLAQRAA